MISVLGIRPRRDKRWNERPIAFLELFDVSPPIRDATHALDAEDMWQRRKTAVDVGDHIQVGWFDRRSLHIDDHFFWPWCTDVGHINKLYHVGRVT